MLSCLFVTLASRGKKGAGKGRVGGKAMTEAKERHRVDNDGGVSAQICEKRSQGCVARLASNVTASRLGEEKRRGGGGGKEKRDERRCDL